MKHRRARLRPVLFAVIFWMFWAANFCAWAQQESYQEKIDRFFDLVSRGENTEAVDFIYGDNAWISKKADAVANVRTQFSGLKQIVGDYRAHEKIAEKKIAGRFAYIQYFVAYDRQPLSFVFEYYRPGDQWMLYSFSFNADIDDQIAELAKKDIALSSR